MKTKLVIGAAVLALGVLSNVAVANKFTYTSPVGSDDFFVFDGYTLNPRTQIMEVIIVPKKNCERMLAFFDAENGGIAESSGGFFEVRDVRAGRKYRQTMITGLRDGGTLDLRSVTCYNNNNRQIETLDGKKGYSNTGGSRPSPAAPAPSLRDLPFWLC